MDSGSAAPLANRPSAGETNDTLEMIERQAAVLVRHFELLYRRSDFYGELDRADYLLLCTLEETGPADINTLAATLGLDPSTAGRQVTALQRADLIDRMPSGSDRRRSIITPTAEGRRRMRAAHRRRVENFAELLDDWTAEDLHALGEMFTRYNKTVADRYLTRAGAPAPVGQQP